MADVDKIRGCEVCGFAFAAIGLAECTVCAAARQLAANPSRRTVLTCLADDDDYTSVCYEELGHEGDHVWTRDS